MNGRFTNYLSSCLCIVIFAFVSYQSNAQNLDNYTNDFALAQDTNTIKDNDSKPLISIKAKAKLSVDTDKKSKSGPFTSFLGIGAQYLIPYGDLDEFNESAFGFNLKLESRAFCNVWHGIKLEYTKLSAKDSIVDRIHYFKSYFGLGYNVKYVLWGSACKGSFILPYIQGGLQFSGIDGTDKKSLLGLGGRIGAGAAFPFVVYNRCCSVDLDADFNAPNAFLRAEGRENIQMINVGLTLSVGI